MECLTANQIIFSQREIQKNKLKEEYQKTIKEIDMMKEDNYPKENQYSNHHSLSNRPQKPYDSKSPCNKQYLTKYPQQKESIDDSFSLINFDLNNNAKEGKYSNKNIFSNKSNNCKTKESDNKSLSILPSGNVSSEVLSLKKLNQSRFSFSPDCFVLRKDKKEPEPILSPEEKEHQQLQKPKLLSSSQIIFNNNEPDTETNRADVDNKKNNQDLITIMDVQSEVYIINNEVLFTLEKTPKQCKDKVMPNKSKKPIRIFPLNVIESSSLHLPNTKLRNAYNNPNLLFSGNKNTNFMFIKEALKMKLVNNCPPKKKKIIQTVINEHPEEYHSSSIEMEIEQEISIKQEIKNQFNLIKNTELLQSKEIISENQEIEGKEEIYESNKQLLMLKTKPTKKDSNYSCTCAIF